MGKTKTLNVETTSTNEAENQVKIAQTQEKFDALQNELNEKGYGLVLDKTLTSTLINDLYPVFAWKGYESYAITETYKQISAAVKKEEINAKFPVEVIEATFHFLKNHEGKGHTLATNFKLICDAFAVSIQEINTDRQKLKDLSLELVAAEKGIDINDLIKSLNDGSFEG
jgi:hypothetical protein